MGVELELQGILEGLGDFGPYQKFQHFLHLLTWLTAGVHVISFVFVFPKMDHRCLVEQVDGLQVQSPNETMALAHSIPPESNGCFISENGPQEDNSSSRIPCPNGYIYSSAYFQSSRVTEWDLVCEREWMGALLQSIFLFGALVGAFVSGQLADKYGRKIVVCLSGLAQLLFGCVAVLISNYFAFAIIMFGYGLFGAAGSVVPAITLTMEIVGPSRRSFCGILFACAFSLGLTIACSWAWLLPQSAQLLQLIFALHSILLLGHWWLMDESICWLWTAGQNEKALEIAKKAARWNGLELEIGGKEVEVVVGSNRNDPEVQEEVKVAERKTFGILDLFKYPQLRLRTLVMMYTWFTASTLYFGLTYNSVNLSGNPYLSFIFNTLVELPANLIVIWLAPKLGNKILLCGSLISSGLASISHPFLAQAETVMIGKMLTIIAKGLATIAFNIINGYTPELFPTVVRNTALGLCVMGSRAGAALVPQINLLGNVAVEAPSISFGTFSCLASLFVVFLMPETLNKTMPQTIEEVEHSVDMKQLKDEQKSGGEKEEQPQPPSASSSSCQSQTSETAPASTSTQLSN
ncbi:unnamed protein product [Orchesella dallaii]|uniref:Organic cation transporter protein n=1 Tax=Orchesella dallaii TaxID=48710 RepID=A0ABP1S9Y2_9HEXA